MKGEDLKIRVCPMDEVAVPVQRAVLSDVDLVRLTKVNLRTLKNLYKQQFTDTKIVTLRATCLFYTLGPQRVSGLRPEYGWRPLARNKIGRKSCYGQDINAPPSSPMDV